MPTVKKSEKDQYNASSEDFVPVACHFDSNSLLTKNGELVQIFQINGINSEKISKALFNLREMVRQAIRDNVNSDKLAFWIHTIRRKEDLDDAKTYNNILSANIHEIWRKKNYWHDKFVNCLYVTVIYTAPVLRLKNFNSLVNSLSPKIITNFEESYFKKAASSLNATVDKIVGSLSEYGAVKLGIRTGEDGCFSDPMFLYRRIMQLNEEECRLPITDISIALSSHQYLVGNDMIEVIDNENKKFAGILSIKEYQEVSSEALDKFLQIPVEMVATEVFYFVDKNEVLPKFTDQNYIADVSGDKEIKALNGLDQIFSDVESVNKFCHQQISIMIVGENAKNLNDKIKEASDTLAKIGIVHVREDINLEKTFWAQLPGNFAFLARMSPTILNSTAALASLHNFPTGNQYNPWGRAITLLRTEKGTPYFMNFHDLENNSNCCILGIEKSGRTTLMNFLLSEADKFKPTIVHIVDDLDSGLYVKAKGGRWFQRDKGLINPLFLDDTEGNRAFCFEFFKILAKHHFDPLKEEELQALKNLSDSVFSYEMNQRKLSVVIDNAVSSSGLTGGSMALQEGKMDSSVKPGNDMGVAGDDIIWVNIKKRLKDYVNGGLYYELFETDEQLVIEPGEIVAISLEMFDDEDYRVKNFPKEKKLIEEYEYNLNTMRSVKAAIVYSMNRLLASVDRAPKIFAIDNMAAIINMRCYSDLIAEFANNIAAANGVFLSSVNIHILEDLYEEGFTADWLSLIGTKLLLPPEVKIKKLDEILNLSTTELRKLESLTVSSRMFLIQQDGKTIASELSIGGLPGLTRILSSGIPEIEIYKQVVSQYSLEKLENWVGPLYDELANV